MSIKEKIDEFFTKENLIAQGKELLDTVLFVIIALIVIRFFIFEPRIIPSASMHPTLIEKDRLIIERYSRFFTAPKYGDIIVFYPPQEKLKNDVFSIFARLTGLFCKDVAYIKRVIGVPGDRIDIVPETYYEKYSIYINGRKISEPYIRDAAFNKCTEGMYCSIYLNKDEFYVMGDNRGNSYDSRYWGPVKRERIIGVTKYRFWPLNRLATFKSVKK